MSIEILQQSISPLLNENVLKEMLQKKSGFKQVILDKITIEDGSLTKGYSFLSCVSKFTLEGTARESDDKEKKITCAVIIKTLPKVISRRISFRLTDFFRNEVIFYNDVWAALTKFQDEKKLKNKFDSIPLCLSAVTDGENDYIALEDLSIYNYGHFKKEKELDYESIVFIMRLFARFHALSFAFKDQFPKEFKDLANKIEETYFHEKFRKWYTDFQKTLITVSRDAIEKEFPSYLKKFDEMIANDLFGKLCKIGLMKDDKLSVFNQGDSWIPNFLGKYDDNDKIFDIKIIDFQLARCCTPSCDLSLFIFSCTPYELYNTRTKDLLKEYHSEFTKFLSELGSDPKIFKFEDLLADWKKNAIFGYAMSMEGVPFQMMDPADAPDMDLITGTAEFPITDVWNVLPIKDQEGRIRLGKMFKHLVDHELV